MTAGHIPGNLETHGINFFAPMGVREAVIGRSSTLQLEQIPHGGLKWPRLDFFQEAPQRQASHTLASALGHACRENP